MSSNTRSRWSARIRWVLTSAVVSVAVAAMLIILFLGRQNLSRLSLVDSRLQDTGRFSEARAQLQRSAFSMLPATLSGDYVLVKDVLLQLQRAQNLGSRLPDGIRVSLQRLAAVLQAPVVLRDDLVAAATLLDSIDEAEAAVQERIFADARSDIQHEQRITLAGLLLLLALSLVGVWVVPRGAVAPFRPFMRLWMRGVLDQRKTLLRAERLALAGEAAAVLAHELRNPLAGVTMALQNLERDTPVVAPRIRPVVSELERVTRTLNEHLGALRSPPESPTPVDVRQLVLDLTELLRYEAGEGVDLRASLPPALVCRTSPDRLRQVLLNLGLNALQALESSGGTVLFDVTLTGRELKVAVQDDGPGFPESVLAGTTAPFSTTKPGGLGLGLRLVRRKAAELGGMLELSNPDHGGALAVLRLPCEEEAK